MFAVGCLARGLAHGVHCAGEDCCDFTTMTSNAAATSMGLGERGEKPYYKKELELPA